MTLIRSRWLRTIALLCAPLTISACGGSSSSPPPPNLPPPPPPPPLTVELEEVFSGVYGDFALPVAMMQAPGDSSRWFVVLKGGVVRVFDNDPNVATSSTFIDISSRVDAAFNESGLLGMAFHPDWGTGGNYEVFLSYTTDSAPLRSVVSRFYSLDNGATLDTTVEDIILTIEQDFSNHNGGNIAFGPDGYLYAGWGDGGDGGDPLDRAQDDNYLLGTMTRIDVDSATPYAIPGDNPNAGNSTCPQGAGAAACPEIFANGLRNPWRWSFDRDTGDIWLGDVGQQAREEVDVIVNGGNYGWRCREGTEPYDNTGVCPGGFEEPILDYGRSEGQSITGGYVYRGTEITALQGEYVFGDFGSGMIWNVSSNSGPGATPNEMIASGLDIASFAEGNDGELYVIQLFPTGIYQIVPAP